MASCNPRSTAGQWIKGGKYAIIWTLLSCHGLRASAVRLRAHTLANDLANLLRTLALPARASRWSLTAPREKLVKIGAKVVRRGRSAIFQLAEAAVPRGLFKDIPPDCSTSGTASCGLTRAVTAGRTKNGKGAP